MEICLKCLESWWQDSLKAKNKELLQLLSWDLKAQENLLCLILCLVVISLQVRADALEGFMEPILSSLKIRGSLEIWLIVKVSL